MGEAISIRELLDGKVTGPEYEANARRLFGRRARIARIASGDPDDRAMEGLAGELTAPFVNFQGLLGVYLDGGQVYRVGWQEEPLTTRGADGGYRETMNLDARDTVEMLD